MKKRALSAYSHLALLCLLLLWPAGAAADPRLVLASTTSTQNSGLFDLLLPAFEREKGVSVHVIAVGTGQALALGRRGDCDLLFVHDPAAEERFVKEGWGLARRQVMYNDFVLVGPPNDPAGVRGMDVVAAFRRLSARGFRFASRGDDSGTHRRELELWRRAGAAPRGAGYLAVGQGMEQTLRLASELGLYALSDRGTWLAVRGRHPLRLSLLVEEGPLLRNQYSVIVVNPARHPHVKAKEATAFAEWVTSPAAQAIIGGLRDRGGHPLFVPNAAAPAGASHGHPR